MHTTASARSTGHVVREHIKVERRPDVGQARFGHPGSDGCAHLRVGVAGLPCEAGQRPGKMDDVLAGPAGDLQHQPALGQNTPENRKDWLLVALSRRRSSPLIHANPTPLDAR